MVFPSPTILFKRKQILGGKGWLPLNYIFANLPGMGFQSRSHCLYVVNPQYRQMVLGGSGIWGWDLGGIYLHVMRRRGQLSCCLLGCLLARNYQINPSFNEKNCVMSTGYVVDHFALLLCSDSDVGGLLSGKRAEPSSRMWGMTIKIGIVLFHSHSGVSPSLLLCCCGP